MGEMALRSQPGVLRFVGIGRKYCETLDSPIKDRDEWIERLLRTLAALYAAAFALPDVSAEECDCDVPNGLRVQHEEWHALWSRLGDALGDARYHWAYFDPTEPRSSQEEAIIHDLADDLADIYRDVQFGLRALEVNVEGYVPEAIWEWRYSFQHHWGHHAVSALRALHHLAYY
jgi:hypothetical protein